MKRAIFLALVFVLVAAPSVLAQSQSGSQQPAQQTPPKQPKPADPADVETLTGRPNGQAEAEPAPKTGHPLGGQAAPKKGHPLDPRDVDILTGKADRYAPRNNLNPYVYVDTPVGGSRFGYSQFGSSQFSPVSTRVSPLPFAFGRVGNRSFFFVGGRQLPVSVFLSRGRSFFILP